MTRTDHFPQGSQPMSGAERKKREPEFDNNLVRSISEAVYRDRLGEDDTRRMIEKDGDNGEKLRERSMSYDSLTRSYMRAIAKAESTSPKGASL